MATLVSAASGNFTSASTWKLSNSTAELDSETNSTATTTSFVASQSFTPGAITVDAVGVKILSRSVSPTGTFTVELYDATLAAAVAGTTIAINVSDIHVNAGGWYFVSFTPTVLVGGNNYQVRVRSSSASQVTVYRNATAGNWSRILRTTTTQVPNNTDKLIVAGDFTAAATFSTYTVTMNNVTSAVTFGEVQVCNHGILSWGTAASTNYYLKIAGNLNLYGGSIYEMGTSGTPMPSTSTAKLEFANTSNVQFGLEARIGSTLTGYGATKTVKAFLAADASAAATSLTTDVSTGWSNGDMIALASTTRTASEAEAKVLTANAAGTTLTITALTNAHSGTSPTQGELANLTRNVQIFGTSTAFQAYINIVSSAIVDMNYMEFYNLGSATASKRGIDVFTTTGSCNISNCSLHDFTVTSSFGLNAGTASGNNFIFNNNVFYLIANSSIIVSSTTGTNFSITNNLVIRSLAGSGYNISDLNGTVTGNTATSCAAAGMQWTDVTYVNGVINNNLAHSNATIGHQIINVTDTFGGLTSLKNFTAWRNNTFGVTFSNVEGIFVDGIVAFGNLTSNIEKTGAGNFIKVINIVANAGVTLSCPIGLSFASDTSKFVIDDSTFGVTTTHSTADISVRASNIYVDAVFRNCLMSSTTPVTNTSINTTRGSVIAFQKYQQIANSHRAYRKEGLVTLDTSIFHIESPSSRMTPSFATIKLKSKSKLVNIASGKAARVSVWVRKSVVGDGVAYNGSQIRLIQKADPALGLNSEVVLATGSAAAGIWEQLTATSSTVTDNGVLRFSVDCDGTAGWINVDDWAVF